MAETATHAAVETVRASAYTIPTDAPESDGTLEWDSTTLVLVEVEGGGERGIGWTYGHAAAAEVVNSKLASAVEGRDALDPPAAYAAMNHPIRNSGRSGIASLAISAVDIALYDLKAKLLGVPLAKLIGRVREGVPVYGSGGFCSYSLERIREQLADWVEHGIPRVKMKVARNPDEDPARLGAAREAIGPDTELLVDANGAFTPKQALWWAGRYADEWDVTYLEEPVSSDDLDGLRHVRQRAPARMAVAAGEYGWTIFHFKRLLESGAVDILQADVTRCGGITGFIRVDALCRAWNMPLSAHTAPQISAHAGAAAETLIHLEHFHDHARIENMLFDGVLQPDGGALHPDEDRPGLGVAFRESDAKEYAA